MLICFNNPNLCRKYFLVRCRLTLHLLYPLSPDVGMKMNKKTNSNEQKNYLKRNSFVNERITWSLFEIWERSFLTTRWKYFLVNLSLAAWNSDRFRSKTVKERKNWINPFLANDLELSIWNKEAVSSARAIWFKKLTFCIFIA